MKILLIGYGKMGQTIAALAAQQGHEIVGIVDLHASQLNITDFTPATVDVAIEFTHPDSALANVTACLRQGIPVVCGSTGWLHHFDEAQALTQELGGIFRASLDVAGYTGNLSFQTGAHRWVRPQARGRGANV